MEPDAFANFLILFESVHRKVIKDYSLVGIVIEVDLRVKELLDADVSLTGVKLGETVLHQLVEGDALVCDI